MRKRKAVAPVLATLLMIAVAVAMSVIIFMWSQGFLSNTSSATGSQQGAQNVAAQSSINIESTTHSFPSTLTLYIRNVGSVSVTLGQCILSGISSNVGFRDSAIQTIFTASTISKGTSTSATITTSGIIAGDVITSKCTTNVGTFASSQYLVP